jgi:hypothetical protein
MTRPTDVETQLRSAGRLVQWALIAFCLFIALIVAAFHHGAAPAVAPCPPAQCALHAHAPHGPTP